MRTSDGFRFSLKFRGDTEIYSQLGEILEKAGNKKSKLILAALSEYIENHPEILKENKIHIQVSPAITKDLLKEMIREIVDEHFNNMPSKTSLPHRPANQSSSKIGDADLAALLAQVENFM